ncbi:MAG: class I SAM-dependent methyltransferase, partial [Burkholderiales bacterium]
MSAAMQRLVERIGSGTSVPFQVELADGSSYRNLEQPPEARIRFRNRRAHWKTLLFGHVGILEAYFDGDVEIEGDMATVFAIAFDSGFDRTAHDRLTIRLRNKWHEWRFSNRSIDQARTNARFHYGLGTEFYRLWLDQPLMMYTCAYWPEGTRSVEEAQVNKIEHVCRKIQLKPGESVIDIGTGFGGFMLHAVEHY